MADSRYDYEPLLPKMLLTVESSLSSPLSGCTTIEMQPRDKVGNVIQEFLHQLQENDIQRRLVVYDKHYNCLDLQSTLDSQGVTDGATLYIGFNRPPKISSLYVGVAGIFTLIIGGTLFISASILFGATGGVVPFDYGIVIDAGSTHTEVFLYRWYGSKDHGTGQVSQDESCTFEQGIGESPDPSVIVPCVSQVVQSIPKSSLSRTPLYLGATAGMRLLNLTEPKDASLILLTLKYALQTTAVNISSISIIQGKDEGIFSWITVNFLRKTLHPKEVDHSWNSTYGALDLGGASTQFAYALDPAEATNSSEISKLKLYGYNYYVRSKSFLCYGLSQAFLRNEALLTKNLSSVTIYDPCLPKQYSYKVKAKKLFNNPCIQNKFFSDWLQKDQNMDKEFNFIGVSDYDACRERVVELLNPTACKKAGFKECSEVVNIALANGKFMAFSSFYYVTAKLQSTNVSLEDFMEATKDWCELSYDEMKNRTHKKSDLSWLFQYCFGAIYIAEFLTSNYGFNSSTWGNIIFQQQVEKTDVGWSLGYMINATNAIPEELPSPSAINSTIYALLVILSLLQMAIAMVLVYKHFKFCCKQNNHQRLLEA